jgi:(p)ppGpp synthase/HD superfamily hydrolase
MADTAHPRLGARFVDAFQLAESLHRNQVRKGGAIPYVSHLMAVAGTVLEHDGDEDEAIAALLHDAVEDQGGLPVLVAIRERFGDRVAAIVAGCSDSALPKSAPKPPWRERKAKYLEHFRHADAATRRVSMADKLHNCRTTTADLHELGEATWSRFNASREDQLWFYRAFVDTATALESSRLGAELERAVRELERAAGRAVPA